MDNVKPIPIKLFITHIEKEGPFLKVWGQAEKSSSVYVEQFLSGASRQFDQGTGMLAPDTLQMGSLVAAKYKDGKYYRARILSIDVLNECFIEVSFIDFGHKDIVPAPNLRSLQSFPPTFLSIPPLATSFIFAEVHSPHGGEWNDKVFETIHKELCFREVECAVVAQATQFYLIKLFIGSSELANLFIGRGLLQPISIQAQQAVLLSLSMHKRLNPVSSNAAVPTEINTYKACTLEAGCQYPVYVSYVNEGPTHFSVQLRQSEEVLVKLMKDINSITLKLLEEVPLPGTICLARCQEDKSICRAVVTNEVDNQFKVFYVDFGNYEVVPLEALYQIPFKFVIPKVMAIRFGLVGIEKSSVTLEMKCAFKKFVDNRLLHMKVLPSPTRTSVSKCELWDPETKISALEVVQRAALNAYPEPLSLNRGFSQSVKVSYVFSCNRFYVQLASKEAELANLMADLQASCQTADVMDPAELKAQLPCCALFEGDQQWYRREIVEIINENNVKVRYIDYGNEEIVPIGLLRMVEGELLTVLRPQAIECCLNGYQNMEADAERDALLEELILEQQFTMKVVEMMDKKALVELTDEANYNVASLLLDKIAAAKALVSPVIPVVTSKPEQHWRSQQNGTEKENFRSERRQPRENKNWNENRTNDTSWRQQNGDSRDSRQDRNSNENSSDNNWRQNNKGYRGNNDRSGRRDINNRLRRDSNKNTENWGGNSDFNSIQESTENTADNWGSADNSNQTPLNNVSHSSGPQGDAGWGDDTPQNDGGFKDDGFKKPRDDRFGGRNKRFDNDKENRYARDGRGDGGFKKKSDFRRDDMSSSGSEKSFKRGPRTSSRNDRPRNDRFGGGRNNNHDGKFQNSFGSTTNTEDAWNVSAVSLPPMNSAASTDEFATQDVVGSEAAVSISWFHNPVKFYCQLTSSQTEFKQMMEEIQEFYKGRKSESAVTGAPIVGLFPEDNVLYRGRVLDVFGSQYKVFYVDFGNISTIDKLWPIDKKFMELPAQALLCGLSEVGPPGETWPSANNYEKYFQKESFIARFLYKDEERTYVNLFDGDQEVSQLLLNDGTAVPLTQQPATSDIEIPLLLGQQFRVIVKSINNLSDIIVALECGLALSCKAHNLDLASEIYEVNLKAYLEQTVIIYVDNILENNVLDATFYDSEGNKINTLTPDEGAFENVEPLCPFLVLNSTVWGYVSHVEENSAFIQPSQFADAIAVLLEQLFEFYEKQTQESPLIPEEGLLYAARSTDSNWYRARVISFDDETATVNYVDYGNSESLPFAELRELNEQFHVPHVLCIEIHMETPAATFLEKDVVATIYYGESGWEGTIQESVQSETAITASEVAPVLSEPLNVVSEVPLVEEAVPVQEEPTSVPELSAEPTPLPEPSQTSTEPEPDVSAPAVDAKGTPVFVSHIDSPNEFYLQRAETSTDLEEVQAYLQEVADSLEPLESVTVGVLCAAPYSVDHQWYRAEVLDADDDITTVRFVDYGNTDVINNKTTQVKTLPPFLLSLAVHATRCSLKVKPIEADDEWTQTALECFEELANQDEVMADFVGQDEKKNYVDLYVHGKNVTEVLIQQNHAKPWEVTTETKSTGFVSHLNSPSEFWLQLANCIDELEWIAEQLSGAESFPELEDLTPGTLCAALFADDEMWYRARILSNTVAGIELLFIDYGNSCISASLRQLPEDLVVTAPLALKCSLQKPVGIPQWSPQACERFREISADGQTIFTVKKISTGETSVVDLLLNDVSVVESLLPETVDGHVKNFESLDKFNVETHGEVSETTYKLEPLPGLKWNDDSCNKFKEINNEGSTLFQIEFLRDGTVRIYSNKSDIRLNLGGTKIVLANLSTAPDTNKTEQVDTENVVPEVDVSEEIVVDYDESQTSYVLSPKKDSFSAQSEENSVGKNFEHLDNISTTDDPQFCDVEPHEQGTTAEEETSNVTPDTLLESADNVGDYVTESVPTETACEPVVSPSKDQNTQVVTAEVLNTETMTVGSNAETQLHKPDKFIEIENKIEVEEIEICPENLKIKEDIEVAKVEIHSENLQIEMTETAQENVELELTRAEKEIELTETARENSELELTKAENEIEFAEIETQSESIQIDLTESEQEIESVINSEAKEVDDSSLEKGDGDDLLGVNGSEDQVKELRRSQEETTINKEVKSEVEGEKLPVVTDHSSEAKGEKEAEAMVIDHDNEEIKPELVRETEPEENVEKITELKTSDEQDKIEYVEVISKSNQTSDNDEDSSEVDSKADLETTEENGVRKEEVRTEPEETAENVRTVVNSEVKEIDNRNLETGDGDDVLEAEGSEDQIKELHRPQEETAIKVKSEVEGEKLPVATDHKLEVKSGKETESVLIDQPEQQNEIEPGENVKQVSELKTIDEQDKIDDVEVKSISNQTSDNDEDTSDVDSKTEVEASEKTADKEVECEIITSTTEIETSDKIVQVDIKKSEPKEKIGEKDMDVEALKLKIETSQSKEQIVEEEMKIESSIPKSETTETQNKEDVQKLKTEVTETVVIVKDEKASKSDKSKLSSGHNKEMTTESETTETQNKEDVRELKSKVTETIVSDKDEEASKSDKSKPSSIHNKEMTTESETTGTQNKEDVQQRKSKVTETVVIDKEEEASKSDKLEPSSGHNKEMTTESETTETQNKDVVQELISKVTGTVVIDTNEEASKSDRSEPSSGHNSRPLSACSGRISHDDRIVPAVLSRPQTPLSSDEESET